MVLYIFARFCFASLLSCSWKSLCLVFCEYFCVFLFIKSKEKKGRAEEYEIKRLFIRAKDLIFKYRKKGKVKRKVSLIFSVVEKFAIMNDKSQPKYKDQNLFNIFFVAQYPSKCQSINF